jgi:uncharacterized protein YkwD
VAIADRDYMRRREPPEEPRSRGSGPRLQPITPQFVAALAAIGVLTLLAGGRLGLFHGRAPFTVGPVVTAPPQLYPRDDPWAAYLPAPNACAESTNASAPPLTAESAMICVLNYARMRDGLAPLPLSSLLNRSAELKAADIVRCGQFDHAACGKDPRAVADEVGYPQVGWGENLAMSPGPFAAARVAADGWLNSEHHRENLFDPKWTEQGVAEVVVPEFQGQRDVAIWVSEFGDRTP